MSLPFRTNIQQIKKRGIIALGLCGVAIIAFILAPASGAYFFDAREGHATASTGTFGLNLNDGNVAFDFGFDGLAPGVSHDETFTVENTGTLPGTLAFYNYANQTIGGANPDISQLRYSIEGFGDVTPAPGNPHWVTLGVLQGGETKTYKLTAALSTSAGAEWEGTTVTNTVGLTLSQVH